MLTALLRNRESDDDDDDNEVDVDVVEGEDETEDGDERKAELADKLDRTVVKHSTAPPPPLTPTPAALFATFTFTPSPMAALRELSFWRLGLGNFSLTWACARANAEAALTGIGGGGSAGGCVVVVLDSLGAAVMVGFGFIIFLFVF